VTRPGSTTQQRIETVDLCSKKKKLVGRVIRPERHRLIEWKEAGKPADTAVVELYDY